MKIDYDPEADAAYILLAPAPERSVNQVTAISNPTGDGEINLDFNVDGRLIGIEVLCASRVLPENLLSERSDPLT